MLDPRRLFFGLCLASALTGGACAPLSVTIGVGPGDRKLHETTVLTDTGGDGDKVAMIDVRGLIADVREPALFGEGHNPVDEFLSRLERAGKDGSVKAVILRINSPGGTVTASDILYREVLRFRETTKKPVVASLGEVAASGGYYLALSADRIIAQPTSITGSIGVIIPTVNFSEGLSRIGIQSRSIKSGPNKDIANPLEPIREGQYAVLQGIVDEFYASFKGLVI
jgi:protease IV